MRKKMELGKIIAGSGDYYLHELAEYLTGYNITCLSCGRKLTQENVRAYEHSHGIKVKGYPQNMWVYFACAFCMFESNITELLLVVAMETLQDASFPK